MSCWRNLTTVKYLPLLWSGYLPPFKIHVLKSLCPKALESGIFGKYFCLSWEWSPENRIPALTRLPGDPILFPGGGFRKKVPAAGKEEPLHQTIILLAACSWSSQSTELGEISVYCLQHTGILLQHPIQTEMVLISLSPNR